MTVRKLDISSEHCPMTFVKTKLELEKMNRGDSLEVLLRKGEPLENVPRSAREIGYAVAEPIHLKNDLYKVVITK